MDLAIMRVLVVQALAFENFLVLVFEFFPFVLVHVVAYIRGNGLMMVNLAADLVILLLQLFPALL